MGKLFLLISADSNKILKIHWKLLEFIYNVLGYGTLEDESVTFVKCITGKHQNILVSVLNYK